MGQKNAFFHSKISKTKLWALLNEKTHSSEKKDFQMHNQTKKSRVFQKVHHKCNSQFLKYIKTYNVCGKNVTYIFEEKIPYPADENPE